MDANKMEIKQMTKKTKKQCKDVACHYEKTIKFLLHQAKENKDNIALINGKLANISTSVTEFHKSVNEIVLNGDGKVRTLEEVLREIYSATKGIRASAGLFDSLKKWEKEAKAGMFITSWFGIALGVVVSVLLFYCVLQTLGFTHITLSGIFKVVSQLF
jgi:predicted RNase H-like nuclease (RuvC/YqgF family)